MRETNRLEGCRDQLVRDQIEQHIIHLNGVEKQLDDAIKTMLKEDELFSSKSQMLTSQKGVGVKTATVLLSHFPELGSLDRREVASIAGMAPHARDSGKWSGRRRIYGGRSAIRKAVYMAAVTAAFHCPILKEFYRRLRENGKPFKVAIIAVARKLLIRLNTLMKQFKSTENPTARTIAT